MESGDTRAERLSSPLTRSGVFTCWLLRSGQDVVGEQCPGERGGQPLLVFALRPAALVDEACVVTRCHQQPQVVDCGCSIKPGAKRTFAGEHVDPVVGPGESLILLGLPELSQVVLSAMGGRVEDPIRRGRRPPTTQPALNQSSSVASQWLAVWALARIVHRCHRATGLPETLSRGSGGHRRAPGLLTGRTGCSPAFRSACPRSPEWVRWRIVSWLSRSFEGHSASSWCACLAGY